CGLEVHALGSFDLPIVADDQVWERLAAQWLRVTAAASSPSGDEDQRSRSLILLGYANAMYNLGSRYEWGRGPARNPREALRCYVKSARLGNPRALFRLAPREPHAPQPLA